jgi:hypothetical protein
VQDPVAQRGLTLIYTLDQHSKAGVAERQSVQPCVSDRPPDGDYFFRAGYQAPSLNSVVPPRMASRKLWTLAAIAAASVLPAA